MSQQNDSPIPSTYVGGLDKPLDMVYSEQWTSKPHKAGYLGVWLDTFLSTLALSSVRSTLVKAGKRDDGVQFSIPSH